MGLYHQALNVAKVFAVQTETDCLVLCLSDAENKSKAENYVFRYRNKKRLADTKCGKNLMRLGVEKPDCGLSEEQIREIKETAVRRLIAKASGNVTAFVKGAAPDSQFMRVELPEILKNPNILTINGEDKIVFAKNFGVEP